MTADIIIMSNANGTKKNIVDDKEPSKSFSKWFVMYATLDKMQQMTVTKHNTKNPNFLRNPINEFFDEQNPIEINLF